MIQTFTMHCGKVEDCSIASITLTHDEGFETVLEGLRHLYGVLEEHDRPEVRPCCEGVKTPYCPTCGRRMAGFSSWGNPAQSFDQLFRGTVDSTSGEGLYDALQEAGWDPFGNPSDVDITVVNVDRWMQSEQDWDGTDCPEPTEYVSWEGKVSGSAWGMEEGSP